MNEIDLAGVDLNLLVLFQTVLEERHVGRAAHRLHLSPSAISHGLKRLRLLLNDPLFLKHPKGVAPTERAESLREPVDRILAQIRQVVATSEPFDAARSQRTFTIGAPDAIAAVVVPAALAEVRGEAPGVRLRVRDLEPTHTLDALDGRSIDVALHPLEPVPARFEALDLYEEDFVIAARSGHAIGRKPSLDRYCAAEHLLVSRGRADRGFVDDLLEAEGRSRRIVLVVPSFMWALAALRDSDLIGTLPRTLVRSHGTRFGIRVVEPPMPIGRSVIRAVTPKAAMTDAGIAWLMHLLRTVARDFAAPHRRRSR